VAELSSPVVELASVQRESELNQLYERWRRKFAALVRIPVEYRRQKSASLPWTETDVEDTIERIWEKMIGPGIRQGHMVSLGRNMVLADGMNIADLEECPCYPICECYKGGHLKRSQDVAGHLFRLFKKGAESRRNELRKRDQTESNAKAKAKRTGETYISPAAKRLKAVADPMWERISAQSMPYLDNSKLPPVDEPANEKGRHVTWERGPKPDSKPRKPSQVSSNPDVMRDNAKSAYKKGVPLSAHPGRRLTEKVVFGKPNPEVTATLDAWRFNAKDNQGRRPHDVRQLTHKEWNDLFVADGPPTMRGWKARNPIVTFAPRQLTGDEPIPFVYGGERRYFWHKTLGRVEFINRCSDGTTWVEVDKDRIQVKTADLSESKWPKPTKVLKTDALAVV
jgi:hypothetical protein